MNELNKYKNEIKDLCLSHGVKFLYAFGSSVNEHFNDQSDIDLLVKFGPVELQDYFANFMDLKNRLESVFHRKIDLVEDQAVKNPIFRSSIDRSKKLIYG